MEEFKDEIALNPSSEDVMKEFGDILFAFINIARFYDIHPEEALFKTNEKFMNRFHYIERKVKDSGRTFEDYTLEELDSYWNEAKKQVYRRRSKNEIR